MTWQIQASELKLWCSRCVPWSTRTAEGGTLSVSWLQARDRWPGVLERPLLLSCSKHPWAAGEGGCASASPLPRSWLGQQLLGCSVKLSLAAWHAVHSPQGSDMGKQAKSQEFSWKEMVLPRVEWQERKVLLPELAVTRSPQLSCRRLGEWNSLISEAPSHSSQGTRPPCTPTYVSYIHVHFCSELSWKYQRDFLCQKCLNHKNHCSEKQNSPPMGDKYSVKVFGNKIPIFLHLIQ